MLKNPLLEEAQKAGFKRPLSQNFLVDAAVLEGIVNQLPFTSQDTVVEIGPGLGFLTEKILPKVQQLIAIDLDGDMIRHLQKKFPTSTALTLVHRDILRFSFDTIEAPAFHMVGNLPYHITAPILFKLCGELSQADHPLRQRISTLTVMVQKEVAERICAQPGTKAYNAFSIALQVWFDPKLLLTIPAQAFYPAPKVTSAVVQLVPRSAPLLAVEQLGTVASLIDKSFQMPRKTLKNNLTHSGVASGEAIEEIFNALGIPLQVRPCELSIQQYGQLAHALSASPCKN